jgi:L-amino acid N-acyltransferase YncA
LIKPIPDDFTIRLGEVGDIPQVLPLIREFYAASQFSSFGIELSEPNAEKFLTMVLEQNMAPYIFAFSGEKLIGWITYYYDGSFFKNPIAVLNTIFVTDKYKRSAVGRILLDAAMQMAREDQAIAFFAPVNSGTKNIRGLENALKKAGFVNSGYIMSRPL